MTLEVGQVVFRSSRGVRVLVGGEERYCEYRGRMRREKRNAVVVGDRVEIAPEGEDRGLVHRVLPRRNWLSRRRDVGGGREIIVAANLDQVVALFSARQPRLKMGALDRLLVAAETQGLPARVVVNKIELGLEPSTEELLGSYPTIGYPLHKVSHRTEEGLAGFRELLRGRASVVAGPSGVGKSSLIGSLLGRDLRVGEVSQATEKGKHTTTAVSWYPIPAGGAVVDTPGFRDFALWGLSPPELARHMPDLRPLVPGCRFRDCLHRGEPECSVREAAEEGKILPWRYRSYTGILESILEQERSR
ncbi:MAG: ribosome small subunit-dependent GTPase A [Planctomycetota bacterium]